MHDSKKLDLAYVASRTSVTAFIFSISRVYFFKYKVWLIRNAVLLSDVQQIDSVIYTHIYLCFFRLFLAGD